MTMQQAVAKAKRMEAKTGLTYYVVRNDPEDGQSPGYSAIDEYDYDNWYHNEGAIYATD
jgi:hypothetical protein